MKSLQGAPVTELILKRVRSQAAKLKQAGVVPYLAVLQVGDDPSSAAYIDRKKAACQELNFKFEHIKCSKNISQQELLLLLDQVNRNPQVHGIVLQLPLPSQLKQQEIVKYIDPEKDIDGLHPFNQGLLAQEGDDLWRWRAPAVRAVIEMLNFYGYKNFRSQPVVVIGASSLFGLPLSLYFLRAGATTTTCQRTTKNLAKYTKEAKLIITAAGQPNLLKPSMIAPRAVVIDGGFTRDGKKLVGDVSRRGDWSKAAAISPVPGGVGQVTVACLVENLVAAATIAAGLSQEGAA